MTGGESAARGSDPAALVRALMALTTVVVVLLAIWLPAHLPAADVPAHMLSAQVHLHPERFVGVCEPAYPPTNWAWTGPVIVLGGWMPVETAGRVVLTLFVALAAAAATSIASTLQTSRSLAAVGGALLILSWPLTQGFVNYLGAMSLTLVAAALWIRHHDRMAALLAASALMLVASVGHMPGAVVMAAWALWVVAGHVGVWSAVRGSWVLAPMALHAAWCVWHGRQSDNRIEGFQQAGWFSEPPLLRLDHLMEFAINAWSPLAEWVGWAALLAAVAAAAVGRSDGRSARRWILASTGIGLGMYLLLPLHMPGWAFLSPRVLPPIVLATFLLVPVSSRGWSAVVIGLLALGLTSTTVSLNRMQQLGEQLDTMVGPAPPSAPGTVYAAIFGVDLTTSPPPFVRAGSSVGFYPMMMGGWGPSAFAHYPTVHTMMFVRPLEELFPSNQAWTEISTSCMSDPTCFQPLVAADRIALEALPWSTVLLAGAPPEVRQRLQQRGFQPWTQTLVRPMPAAVTIELHDPGTDMERPILLRWRWPETGIVVAGAARSASRRVSGQVYRVQWSLPAGPAELVAAVDMDENGTLDAADAVFFRADVTVEPGAALTFAVQRVGTP